MLRGVCRVYKCDNATFIIHLSNPERSVETYLIDTEKCHILGEARGPMVLDPRSRGLGSRRAGHV